MPKLFQSIKTELKRFDAYLDAFLDGVESDRIRDNYDVFFSKSGKHIRPALLYMSLGATSGSINDEDHLHRLALILELLHSASLIHDDIVDDDLVRRGQKTINQVFGNKIAVLAGDTLFSYAFREAAKYYEASYTVPITNLALDMCMAELNQANQIDSKELYFSVIKGKTAQFMSVACELGAKYGGGSELQISQMSELGLCIGMIYQMIDDRIDQDPNALKFATSEDVGVYYKRAVQIMEVITPSKYKEDFKNLIDIIMEM